MEGSDAAPPLLSPAPSPPPPMLFRGVNLTLDCRSRVGIVGANGTGKSTLLKLLLGANANGGVSSTALAGGGGGGGGGFLEELQPTEGRVTRDSRARIGVFTQHHAAQLDLRVSAVRNMLVACREDLPNQAVLAHTGSGRRLADEEQQQLLLRRHLGTFGITGQKALRPCRQLSGGEKSRVVLACLAWRRPHLLVMDEPTNHLDVETIDALIEAVRGFGGGLLLVSHDVHFVSAVCEELFVVGGGAVTRFEGGDIHEYKKRVLRSVTDESVTASSSGADLT